MTVEDLIDLLCKLANDNREICAEWGNTTRHPYADQAEELADHVIRVPKTQDLLCPIINTVPLQLLAYFIADLKGLDVDKPRNLAKSVTVE